MTAHSSLNSKRAFTLIELMAVVLVILVLAAIGMGVAGYVQKKVAIATTRSQIAAIESALESYKSDWGYYPRTSEMRISSDGSAESTNNAILYRALYASGKQYLKFPAEQVRTDLLSAYQTNNPSAHLFDPFGSSFNYYNSPATPFALGVHLTYGGVAYTGSIIIRTNQCTFGGQVNTVSYDLFSYGPDRLTFAAPNANWPNGANLFPWRNPAAAVDDITNWGP